MEFTDEEVADLYDRYAHVLFHRCRSILRNEEDAWDAVQETFARVIKNAETFRRQSSPLTWMYRISTNYSLNQLRNRTSRAATRRDKRADIVGPETTESGDTFLGDHERILELLEDADEQTRACVVHTYFDECTREETAKLVGLSVPTVRKRLNAFLLRARRQLGVAVAFLAAVLPWIRA
ncbi:MAG: RNA polymerase sigma factor [Myxococcales bacterium]|nr:RNA polymerase sigma factor [Myxococcales bacterium]